MTVVSRPRVTEAIEESLTRGVALIIAPAGFGKTEAILDAIGDIGLAVDLPDGAVTPDSFARALLTRVSPRSLRALTTILQRPADPERDAHLAGFLSTKLRGTSAPIIIDDFQRINAEPATRHLATQVIEATAPQVRWLIASRETPELPIGTWLALDWMSLPLNADDLAFNQNEARLLADMLDVPIENHDLAAIVENAEGWPLVVRLALSAWVRTRALIPLHIRTNVILFDFIEAQVWSTTPEEDRRFLLAGALLGETQPGLLADAGFETPGLRLERLERRIPLLRQMSTGVYRFHELFREFIVSRHRHSSYYADVIERLIGALERNGAYAQAILLAGRNELWDKAHRLLSFHGYDLVSGGDHTMVKAALEQLPRRLKTAPITVALRGIIRFNEGSVAAAIADMTSVLEAPGLPIELVHQLLLRIAQIEVNTGKPQDALDHLQGLVEVQALDVALEAQSILATAQMMLGNVTAAQSAAASLTKGLDSVRSDLRAALLGRLAHALLFLGDYAAAETRAIAAVELAEENALPGFAARAYSVLQAVATLTQPDTEMQLHYTRNWVRAAQDAGEKIGQAYALTSLVVTAAERGDDELYEQTTADLRELRVSLPPRYGLSVRWARVLHDGGQGRFREALLALKTFDLSSADDAIKALCASTQGVFHAVLGERLEADELLRRPTLALAATDLGSRQQQAYAHMFRAIGLWLLGRGRIAQRSLGAPVALSERDNLLLGVMRSIVTTARPALTTRKLDLLTAPLVALEFHGQARFFRSLCKPISTNSELTRTELEVLREFRNGGSTVEVAERLSCAPRTVEKHLQGIYRKLGAPDRAAALAHAAGNGWLD